MTKQNHKKKWFTMIELLFVIMLVSTTFMWIITSTISTTNYLTATRQKITALNLAKEWVEIMYNIRNTNRRRRYNQKDANWLKADPFDTTSDKKDLWIHEGRWIIKAQTWTENKYYSLVKIKDRNDLKNWTSFLEEEHNMQENISLLQDRILDENDDFLDENYKLHLLNGRRYNNQDLDNFTWEDSSQWEYRRYIAVDWLYTKGGSNPNTKLNCENNNWTCWDESSKELRFCAIVIYTKPKFWAVQICSIMTNFEE